MEILSTDGKLCEEPMGSQNGNQPNKSPDQNVRTHQGTVYRRTYRPISQLSNNRVTQQVSIELTWQLPKFFTRSRCSSLFISYKNICFTVSPCFICVTYVFIYLFCVQVQNSLHFYFLLTKKLVPWLTNAGRQRQYISSMCFNCSFKDLGLEPTIQVENNHTFMNPIFVYLNLL
jgi:hypothetical protein